MSTRGFVGYRHKGQIHGFYNHMDSYPECLGCEMVKKYCSMTWDQIKDFFLHKLTLIPEKEDTPNPTPKIAFEEWDKEMTTLGEDEFIKDGLFCEYAYVFDLDAKKKRLMLFKGFGKKPSKGYEDYFYENLGGEKFYTRYKGSLRGELHQNLAEAKMEILFREEGWKKIREALKTPLEKLPTLINDPDAGKVAAARLEIGV